MTDKWLIPLIFNVEKDNDSPLNQQFADNGLMSRKVIKNLQSTLVYLILVLFLFLVLLISKVFSGHYQK